MSSLASAVVLLGSIFLGGAAAEAATLGRNDSLALIDELQRVGAPVFISRSGDPGALEIEIDAFADEIRCRPGLALVKWEGKEVWVEGAVGDRIFSAFGTAGLHLTADGQFEAHAIECHATGRGAADGSFIPLSAECALVE
jgi:hypothetical protein